MAVNVSLKEVYKLGEKSAISLLGGIGAGIGLGVYQESSFTPYIAYIVIAFLITLSVAIFIRHLINSIEE